eukprot:gene16838-25820_t
MPPPTALVLMGTSGVGKTTVATEIAERMQWRFLEADDYHSAENRRKMGGGEPLSDADRRPWLLSLNEVIARHVRRGESVVVACSVLKEEYREALFRGLPAETRCLVHLVASREVLLRRLAGRKGHFFPPRLLDSQLATLQLPKEPTITIDTAASSPNQCADTVVKYLRSRNSR